MEGRLGPLAGASRLVRGPVGDGKDDKAAQGKQLQLEPGSIGAVRSCN